MHITNQFGLPDVLVEAVRNDPYDAGKRGEKYITATQLVSPPQQIKLMKVHIDEVVEDVTDRIWSLLGQSVHSIIERVGKEATDKFICEERMYAEVDGWTIGGQVDIYDRTLGDIWDFKVTSVYSANPAEGMKDTWRRQLNILAWLLRKNGYPVNNARICAILRDWSRTKAKYNNRDGEYPMHPASTLAAPMYPDAVVEDYIRQRIRDLESVETRECTDDERWRQGGGWAVMRGEDVRWAVMEPGKARAKKIYDNEDEARAAAMETDEGWVEQREKKASRRAVRVLETYAEAVEYVESRPGEKLHIEGREATFQRCAFYCPVRHFCEQAHSDGEVDP